MQDPLLQKIENVETEIFNATTTLDSLFEDAEISKKIDEIVGLISERNILQKCLKNVESLQR